MEFKSISLLIANLFIMTSFILVALKDSSGALACSIFGLLWVFSYAVSMFLDIQADIAQNNKAAKEVSKMLQEAF